MQDAAADIDQDPKIYLFSVSLFGDHRGSILSNRADTSQEGKWGPQPNEISTKVYLPIKLLLLLDSVLNFGRVTGMLDLEECHTLDTMNLSSAVYISPVQTPPPSIIG